MKQDISLKELSLSQRLASIISDALDDGAIRLMGRERRPYLPTDTAYEIANKIVAASPVHAELERVKAENGRLCAVIDAATTRRAMQHDEDYVKIGYDDWVNLRQALQQKGGSDELG